MPLQVQEDYPQIAQTSGPTKLVSIPVPKGDNATLVEAINQAIAELHAEGVLSEISIKYFGSDITKGE